MRAQRPGESALLLLDAIDSLARSNVVYAVDLPLLRRLAERFGQETAETLDAALRAR